MLNKFKIFFKGSTTYFFSSLFFPKKIREEIFTLYAYVRKIDDIVDKENPSYEEFLEWKRQTLDALKGTRVENKLITDYVQLAKSKKFEDEWIIAFLDSMEKDFTKKVYKSYKELENYMYGSAEVIGLMMAKILDLSPNSYEAARLQGKSMQFINFLRDVKEDNELGRIYLPIEHQKELHITKLKNDDKWKILVKKEVEIYRNLQNEAEKGYQFIPKRYLISIKTASDMYNWTAEKIFKNPEVVWQKKLKPSPFLVIFTIIKNYLIL
jgi:phytoene synthase